MKQEDIKELWEWCEFEYSHSARRKNFFTGSLGRMVKFYVYRNGEISDLPKLTLDNLFKYAVPKLEEVGGRRLEEIHLYPESSAWLCELDMVQVEDRYSPECCKIESSKEENPTEALAQAILKVLRK